MTITIPDNFIPERTYTLDVLFTGMLGIAPQIEVGSGPDTVIHVDRKRCVVIKDGFFSMLDEREGYLKPENVPAGVTTLEGAFVRREGGIPVLFGAPDIEIGKDRVNCSADLLSSSFFMLSRWEEASGCANDEHQRFPSAQSLAVRGGFLDRPVVDEYADLIWNLLTRLGNTEPRARRAFHPVITHDIDVIRYPFMPRGFAHDLLRCRSVRKAWTRLLDTTGNVFDTFYELMDFSESFGGRSTFFFLSGGSTAYENRYPLGDRLVRRRLSDIKARGHRVGLHGSYGSYLDGDKIKHEREALERAVRMAVTEVRMHYLRFRVPETWRALLQAGIHGDSTCGYPDRVGYRCGTGDPYRVFDVLTRKPLPLMEQPLVCMDGALVAEASTTSGVMELVDRTVERARSVNGCVTFLFHNSMKRAWRERGIDSLKVLDHLAKLLGAEEQ